MILDTPNLSLAYIVPVGLPLPSVAESQRCISCPWRYSFTLPRYCHGHCSKTSKSDDQSSSIKKSCACMAPDGVMANRISAE